MLAPGPRSDVPDGRIDKTWAAWYKATTRSAHMGAVHSIMWIGLFPPKAPARHTRDFCPHPRSRGLPQ